jgi:hypothetical protein
MDVLINGIVGLVLVPIYNWIKGGLGLKDKAAAWVFTLFTLLIAFPMALLTGKLAGYTFDLADPFGFMKAVVQAFLVILGSAETFYMLTKERVEKKK